MRLKNRILLNIMLMSPIFMAQQIAPAVGGALIGVGASLIGGLFSAAAQAEERKKQRLLDAELASLEAQKQGAGAVGKNSQEAFEQLIQGYRAALLR